MPADHGVGLDDHEMTLPWLPPSRKLRPEAPIGWDEGRPLPAAFEDRELLPQREVLQDQISTTTP